MDKQPLLSRINTRKPQPPQTSSSLVPLPEDSEITIPPTARELKDMLIFGSPSVTKTPFFRDSSSSNILEALSRTLTSPTPSVVDTEKPDFDTPRSNSDVGRQPSWLIDLNFPISNHRHLHRCKTAPAISGINEIDRRSITKPPQSGKPTILGQGIILLIVYLTVGVSIYSLNKNSFRSIETHPVVDALYFCIVTMCTIGYGDIIPDSTATKLFSITFVLVGFGFVDILLSGMFSYMLDLQESYILKTIKGGDGHNPQSYIVDVKKGRMRIRMKVALALGVVVLCIGIGAVVMHHLEKLNWLDSFYLSVMSVTTVGYGDKAFSSLSGRIFASIWLLVSTLAVARAFLYLAEARVDKRNRRMAKWVLGQDMTVAQFLAADIDQDGFVTVDFFHPQTSCAVSSSCFFLMQHGRKSEFVVYKLKELGKVSEKDILQICKQFERLDSGNCGKITLADLMDSHRL